MTREGKRHPQSRTRGRQQTLAEVALRMLVLKHVRNWSYEILEREVRANVVYRSFCRIGMAKVPDEKTLVRLGQTIGAETIRELHERIVALAQQRRVIHGRKMRVDTTVVESNIHYPTDSGLLNDGARVLTRTMKKIEQKAGGLKKKVRNRMRSVTKRVIALGHALRHKGTEGELKRQKEYRQLLRLTRQILNDSRRVMQKVLALPSRRRSGVRGLGEQLEAMAEGALGGRSADFVAVLDSDSSHRRKAHRCLCPRTLAHRNFYPARARVRKLLQPLLGSHPSSPFEKRY